MYGTPPRVALESTHYPSDEGILKVLASNGLIDAVIVPDLPMGKVNMDSVVAAHMITSHMGIPAYATISLGHRSPQASLSKILSACLLGLDGVLLVAGDVRVCSPRLSVYDAIRYASDLPNAELQGYEHLSSVKGTLKSCNGFLVGAVVDLRCPRSLRTIDRKISKGARFLVTQLMAHPKRHLDIIRQVSSRIYLMIGVPYIGQGSPRSLENIMGEPVPDPGDLSTELEGVLEELGGGNAGVGFYVSAVGARAREMEGLAGFLEGLKRASA